MLCKVSVCYRLITEVVVSNPSKSMDVSLLCSLCTVTVDISAMRRSRLQSSSITCVRSMCLTVWDLENPTMRRPGTDMFCSTVTDMLDNLNCTSPHEDTHNNTRTTSALVLRAYRQGLPFSDASRVKVN